MIHPNRVPGMTQNSTPTPYRSGNAPDLAFGGGGAGLQQLGHGLAGAAQAADRIAVEDDRARVTEAQNAFADWSRQRLFGEDGGYLHSAGRDAVTGAETVSAEFDAKLADMLEGLGNNRQKSQFAAIADQSRQQSLDRVASHAAQQRTAWWSQTSEAAIVAAGQEAALTPEDPRIFGEGLKRVEHETRAIAERGNLDEAAAERMVNQNVAAFIENVSESALSKDPELALKIFEQNRHAFTPEQNKAIGERLYAGWAKAQAAEYVEAADLDGLREFRDKLQSSDATTQLAAIAGGELNKAKAEFAAVRSEVAPQLETFADDLRFGRAVDREKLESLTRAALKIGATDLTAKVEEGRRINADMAVFKGQSLDEMALRIAAVEQAGVTDQGLFDAQKQTYETLRALSQSDPLAAAMEQGIIPTAKIGTKSSAEEWTARLHAIPAVEQAYGNKGSLLRGEEAEVFKRELDDMSASDKAEMLSQIHKGAAGRPGAYAQIMNELAPVSPELYVAGRMMPRDPKAGMKILNGLDVLKRNLGLEEKKQAWSQQLERQLPSYALSWVAPSARERWKAAMWAYCSSHAVEGGGAKDDGGRVRHGRADADHVSSGLIEEAIDKITGRTIQLWPGGDKILAAWPGQTASEARAIVNMVTNEDLKGVNVWSRFPANTGSSLGRELFLECELRAIGNGKYYAMANGRPVARDLGGGKWENWEFDMNSYRDRLEK